MILFPGKKSKQLEAVFYWLSGAAGRNDIILVEDKNGQQVFRFDFPLKIGDKPKQIKQAKVEDLAFFINFSSRRPYFDPEKWICIFQSSGLEIHESKKRFGQNNFKPLRWGLNEEEKMIALSLARKTLEIFLKDKKMPKIDDLRPLIVMPPVFNLKCDLDIALWVDGEFRGSRVVGGRNLAEGIIEASLLASRDPRCRPLRIEELLGARIEICLCSDLKIPISQEIIEKDEILYNKGWFFKKGNKSGWFLPEVFNIRPFANLSEFLSRLAREKAALSEDDNYMKNAEILIFEVDDFIDSNGLEAPTSLDGPILKLGIQTNDIQISAIMAADWLVKTQQPAGDLLPITNPLSGLSSQRDWPRCLLSAWSLAEFGRVVKNEKYTSAAERAFTYFKGAVFEDRLVNVDDYYLVASLVYLGQLALSLEHKQEALRYGSEILEFIDGLTFEPIVFSQLGSFFAELAKYDAKFFGWALKLAGSAVKEFEAAVSGVQPVNAIVWSELANVFVKIFEMTGDDLNILQVKKMIDWLLAFQASSGAFEYVKGSNYVYVRGTGKIVEVLAGTLSLKKGNIVSPIYSEHLEECVNRAMVWIITMQYTKENCFFVPKKNLGLVVGGFRHDYFNLDLWVDSAGHFLLAAVRLLKSE